MDGCIVQKKLKLASSGGQNLIDNLPDECVTNIFSFLITSVDRCSCAAVSKKWLHLLANITLADIKFPQDSISPPQRQPQPQPFSRRLMGKKANDIRLAALALRAHTRHALTYLCIMGLPRSSSITDYGLKIIAKSSPFLNSLNLWDCAFVGDTGFDAVGQWCRDLERLHLINLPMLSDNGIFSIANNCLKLSALSIESCPRIGSRSLEVVASKSLKLHAVSVIKCPLVQDSGIVSVVSNLPELARLKISMMKIGDEVLRAIRDRGKAMQVLHLEKIKGPTEMGYSRIGAMEELKSLKLRLCVSLTGESFKVTTDNNFAALKEIDIQRCSLLTDEVLVELSKSATLMKRLKLEECSGFSSKGLMEALQNWRETLKLLSFNKCSIIETQVTKPGDILLVESYPCLTTLELKQCNGIGDEFLSWMGLACSKVKEVVLVGMNTFTDQGLLRLLIFLNIPDNLTSLDLSGCRMTHNRALHVIVKILGAGLKSLNLESCRGVNDGIMATIATHCVALEELNVDGCGITDLSLWCLMYMGVCRLQSLSLAGCTEITDEGLKWLEQMTWDNLKLLDIRNCPRISDQGAESFQEFIWWCKVICS